MQTKGDYGMEDIIRAFVNISVAEAHAKTNYEKIISEMENGTIDVDDEKVLEKHLSMSETTREQLSNICGLRRRIMMRMYDAFPERNEHEWCMIKHLAIVQNCLFEAYQAGDEQSERLWLDANEEFTKAMSDFLGMEITPCSACFSDMIKEAENGTES